MMKELVKVELKYPQTTWHCRDWFGTTLSDLLCPVQSSPVQSRQRAITMAETGNEWCKMYFSDISIWLGNIYVTTVWSMQWSSSRVQPQRWQNSKANIWLWLVTVWSGQCGRGSSLPPAGVSHKPNTRHLICTLHCPPRNSALSTLNCAVFSMVHCAMSIVDCAFCTVHCILCTVQCALMCFVRFGALMCALWPPFSQSVSLLYCEGPSTIAMDGSSAEIW